MKLLAICAVLLCSLAAVFADYDDYIPCANDLDCKYDECCVLSFTGEEKICREIGDDHGDPCGGQYFCNICARNLECVLSQEANDLHGCAHPANGTCTIRRRPSRRP